MRALERAGFNVLLDPEIEKLPRFTRAEDERRAENLMGMWLDPRVKAVIASTGGYGAVRLLPHLDPSIFRNNPKSSRRLLRHHRAASVAHAARQSAQLSRPHRRRPRAEPARPDDGVADHGADDALPAEADRAGAVARASCPGGRRAGSSAATCRSCSRRSARITRSICEGAILFVEETRDPMSVVDERLVHMRAAGLLEGVAGIVFGQLSLDRSEEDEFEDFLLDLISDLDVPVLMDFPAGHENPNLTIPFGTEVELVVEETARLDRLQGRRPHAGSRDLA